MSGVPEFERMTKQQAEEAQRSFEYPGFVCMGITDATTTYESWLLLIRPVGDQQIRSFTAAMWKRSWARDQWQKRCEAMFSAALTSDPTLDPLAFQLHYDEEVEPQPYPGTFNVGL